MPAVAAVGTRVNFISATAVERTMPVGTQEVHELVEDAGWEYPVSVRRLRDEYPLENIEIDQRGNSMLLSELLAELDTDRFDSRSDLERTVGPVLERESERRRVGWIGMIKRAVLGKPLRK